MRMLLSAGLVLVFIGLGRTAEPDKKEEKARPIHSVTGRVVGVITSAGKTGAVTVRTEEKDQCGKGKLYTFHVGFNTPIWTGAKVTPRPDLSKLKGAVIRVEYPEPPAGTDDTTHAIGTVPGSGLPDEIGAGVDRAVGNVYHAIKVTILEQAPAKPAAPPGR